MGIRLNTNVASLIAQKNIRRTNSALEGSQERLASGSKINRSSDNPAGLAISEKLKLQNKSLSAAEKSTQDSISVLQIAEGATTEISNMISRMRELAMQASSDTIGNNERQFVQKEFSQLQAEMNRISQNTEYNGVKLLDGSSSQYEVQVGTSNNPFIDRLKLFPEHLGGLTTQDLGIGFASVQSKLEAQNSLDQLDQALEKVISFRSGVGSIQNRLQSVNQNTSAQRINIAEANSRMRDTDLAQESSELTKNNILLQSGTAVLAQTNANTKNVLNLLSGNG